jgi:hypothetical protein
MFARLAVPISKYTTRPPHLPVTFPCEAACHTDELTGRRYYVCKRATPVVVEALECHGGNGYHLCTEIMCCSLWPHVF